MKKFPSKIVFILTQLLLLSGCGALIDYAHVSIAPMHFCMSNFVGGNDAPEDYKRKICEKSVADQEKWSKEYDEKQKSQGKSTSTGDVLSAVAQVGIAVAEAKADERLQRKQQAAAQQAQQNQQISNSSTNNYTAASPRLNNTNTPPIQQNQSIQQNNYSNGAQGQPTATTIQNLNSCLTIANQTRGDRCNSATSVLIELRNSCSVPIDAVICVEQSDGRARCTTFGNTSPGKTALNTICNGTGRYKYWGCPAGTGTAKCSGFHEYYSNIP